MLSVCSWNRVLISAVGGLVRLENCWVTVIPPVAVSPLDAGEFAEPRYANVYSILSIFS